MRKKVLLTLLSLVMAISLLPWNTGVAVAKSGIVSIDSHTFPNRTFRSYVRQLDKDKNGVLSYKEAKRVKKIQIAEMGIKNLKGIEHFKWLEKLDCSGNKIKKLDLRKNSNLEELDCSRNEIKHLNLDENVMLKELKCSHNKLKTLHLGKNKELKKLVCHHNRLLFLDLSKNSLTDDEDDYDYEDAEDDDSDYDDDDEANSISPQERIVSPKDKGNHYELDMKAYLGDGDVERVMFVTGKGVTEKDGIISIEKGSGNKGKVVYDWDTRNPVNANRLMKVVLRWNVESGQNGNLK